MNGASGSQKQSGSAKNQYSTVWPAGAEKSDCKKISVKAEKGDRIHTIKN